ncbi:hypothetical protein [Metapseudomonas furukawaii]|uniref:Phage protein n=1 Tax=Metapseudomonas furukawaii TaxID=1149133 RepID=A0AAD1C3I8_METFU|nr:hypothetical protein ppKF707_0747 [Pseudomonas furukawaii]BAU76160.1 phage protein [Pseudomonas furukawaii]
MSTVYDPMRETITLHGLGFIQVQLQGDQRLHVWHPDLPRRSCFEHSAIHNHRFDFESRVLVGQQININYIPAQPMPNLGLAATHTLYLHEGPRTARGGRPWVPAGEARMAESSRDIIFAGATYTMRAYNFHRTEPGGDGRVATLMKKSWEGQAGATSSCLIGVEPDTDFDRFQLPPSILWQYVLEVLGGPCGTIIGTGSETKSISLLDAWEALGHDLGCNPETDEVLASVRYAATLASNDAAVAAITYVLANPCEEPLEFLRCWNEGNFDALRKEWENVPDEVFIGADPLFKPSKESQV